MQLAKQITASAQRWLAFAGNSCAPEDFVQFSAGGRKSQSSETRRPEKMVSLAELGPTGLAPHGITAPIRHPSSPGADPSPAGPGGRHGRMARPAATPGLIEASHAVPVRAP